MSERESFCRICGIIIENAHRDQKYCKEQLCRQEAQRRRRKRCRLTSEERMLEHQERMRILESRPWTSGCIDNLYQNMIKGWDALQTAKETNRNPEDIMKMMELIHEKGFKCVYDNVYSAEKAVQPATSDSPDWLEKSGVMEA